MASSLSLGRCARHIRYPIGHDLQHFGVKISADAVSDKNLEFVAFALQEGVDAFGVSFAKGADDILKVKAFAQKRGQSVYVVAKIERAEAMDNFDEILAAADGIMIARGDLGFNFLETLTATGESHETKSKRTAIRGLFFHGDRN